MWQRNEHGELSLKIGPVSAICFPADGGFNCCVSFSDAEPKWFIVEGDATSAMNMCERHITKIVTKFSDDIKNFLLNPRVVKGSKND